MIQAKFNNIYLNIPMKQLKIVVDYLRNGQNLRIQDIDFKINKYSTYEIEEVDNLQDITNPVENKIYKLTSEYTYYESGMTEEKEYEKDLYIYKNNDFEVLDKQIYNTENLKYWLNYYYNQITEDILEDDETETFDYSDIETKVGIDFLKLFGY